MNYRQFGKTGVQISALGFGAMRLPTIGGENSRINEPEAIRLIRHAIDSGVNYVDTAWPYHGENSESLVGKVLQNGYREKTNLATKMPVWLCNEQADYEKYFNLQLEKLQTDHIDFYLFHALSNKRWAGLMENRAFDWAEKKLAEGKIRRLGFSFHDNYEAFRKILNGYDGWDFCQIQYNYMDTEFQAGQRGLKEAAEKGLGVVIMEPLRGGKLAIKPQPHAVQQVFDASGKEWTPAEWSLQWIWDQPEVSVVLSGMSTMEQLEENLRSASRSGIGALSDADAKVMEDARQAFKGLMPIPCTRCGYCQPCPNGVFIPDIFGLYNTGKAYDKIQDSINQYGLRFNPEDQADQCVECGQCESQCPQHIEIIDWLKTVHKELKPAA